MGESETPTAAQLDHAGQACARLSLQFPTKVFPGKTGAFKFWDAKQSDIAPTCRVEPESANDVSAMLKILVQERCHFAVKSGGNAREAGSSNASGGVTIDLVRLNKVSIANDRKSVKIGAGLKWLDVYSKLDPEGLTVFGGRISTVGVGGFLLSGGISLYSRRHGWACDSIISYEVVLPSGQITNVDMRSHPELNWALRGAGASNFGIVTSFVMVAIELPNPRGIWMGQKAYAQDQIPHVLDHTQEMWSTEDKDLMVMNTYVFFPEKNVFSLFAFRGHAIHDDPSSWPKSLSSLETIESIPGMSKSHVIPIAAYASSLSKGFPPGKRNTWLTFTYRPSREFDGHLYSIFEDAAVKLKGIQGIHLIMSTQLLPRSTISALAESGGNCLGISDNSGPLVLLLYGWSCFLASDDQVLKKAAIECFDNMEVKAKDLGVWHPFRYMNYADEKIQAQQVWDGYGHESVTRLRNIQKSVDPTGVFAHGGLASGYFKLNISSKSNI